MYEKYTTVYPNIAVVLFISTSLTESSLSYLKRAKLALLQSLN